MRQSQDWFVVTVRGRGEVCRVPTRARAEQEYANAVRNCRKGRHGWSFPVTLSQGGLNWKEAWE